MTGGGFGPCAGGRRNLRGRGGAFGWRHRQWAPSSAGWRWRADPGWTAPGWTPAAERGELRQEVQELERELERLRARLGALDAASDD
jgi:hypothetical protein